MPKTAIITIGDEILRGRIIDTNSAWLAKKLFLLGVDVIHHQTVPDRLDAISKALSYVNEADIIITTGGLGPTPDDATRKALSEFLGKKLIFHEEIAKTIEERFIKRGIKMPEVNLVQAYLPEGGIALENPEGTAPGIFVEWQGKLIFLLPGPPREMQAVYPSVEKILRERFKSKKVLNAIFKTIGVPESVINEWIQGKQIPQGAQISYYPSLRGVDVFIVASEESVLDETKNILSKILGKYTFSHSEEDRIEKVIGELLRKRGQTLATAESCTGGMLASLIVDIPGSSDYFLGGVVSYSNEAKMKFLGVSEENLIKYGAVSPQVAFEMSSGVRDRFQATFGIGITGIAGPTGATLTKPVGLVYISVASPEKVWVRKYHFVGGRNAVRTRSATAALNMLWVALKYGELEDYPFEDGGEFAR